MNTGLISVRYATALLEFAKEKNSVEQVYAEAKMLTLMFSKMSQLRIVIENPVVSTGEKKKLILSAAGGNPSKTFSEFVDLVMTNNRENQIRDIMFKFIDLYREEKGIRYGKLTTALDIDSDTEKRLISLITDKAGGTLELEKIVEPDLLGGFILEVEGVRWDASLSGQLKRIKNEYIERNRRII